MSGYALAGGIVSGIGSLIGAGIQSANEDKAQQREYQRQKEFAQNAVQWKVQDAKNAGLHPLYALSGSTATYSPQSTAGSEASIGADVGASFGKGIASLADMKTRQLQNELLQAQIDESRSRTAKNVGSVAGSASPPTPPKSSLPKSLNNDALSLAEKTNERSAKEALTYGYNQYGNPIYGVGVSEKGSDNADAHIAESAINTLTRYTSMGKNQAYNLMKQADLNSLKNGEVYALKNTRYGWSFQKVPISAVSQGDTYMLKNGQILKRQGIEDNFKKLEEYEKKHKFYPSAKIYSKISSETGIPYNVVANFYRNRRR